ncbi:LysR family transcriptional regulator [Agromyces atrinae]|uniref:LysR family transcriptional regulator n=1 Tax=Agromyces atrinae TaxID=592376 RepID=UPI001F573848|nr:LysR family transcriptional regulator [Agromyces atrinae]MCI2959145.1 LysR family transcriptional regulator [Agromyces atrinae]
MNIDVRHLRAIVALADEESFTDAARVLGVSQAAVSRAITSLESDLGARLVHRTTRHVSLSAAGLAFVVDARRILDDLERSIARVRGDSAAIRFGYAWAALGRHTTPVLREWNRRHPAEPLRVVRLNRRDVGLHDGLVDLAVTRHLITDPAIESTIVGSERRLAALPVGHRLADSASISLADLITEMVGSDGATGTTTADLWHDAGLAPPRLVPTGDVEEWLEAIAAEEIVGVTSAATAHHYPRPGVVFVPIRDAPTIEVRLAWAKSRRHPSTDRIARRVAAAYARTS